MTLFRPSISLTDVQRRALTEVHQRLADGRLRTRTARCLCGAGPSPADRTVVPHDRYGLPFAAVLCHACGIVRCDPVLTDESLQDFYAHHYRSLYTGSPRGGDEFFTDQLSRGRRLAAHIPATAAKGPLLEIGCGAGGILAAFAAQGWGPAIGVDLDDAYLEHGRRKGLDLRLGDFRAAVPDGSQSLIVLSHVLEHLPDPVATLREAAVKLRPDGLLLLEVPGLLSIHRVYGPSAHYWQGAHLYNFSHAHLRQIVIRAGFIPMHGDESATLLATRAAADAAPGPHTPDPALAGRIHAYLRRQRLLDRCGLSPATWRRRCRRMLRRET